MELHPTAAWLAVNLCVDHEVTIAPQLEVLDLRHFSAAQLRPLLEDEARRWNERLRWDYTRSTEILLEYLDGHVLQGFAAMHEGRGQGYAFSVYEAEKAG